MKAITSSTKIRPCRRFRALPAPRTCPKCPSQTTLELGTNRPANSAEDVTTRGTYGLNDVFTAVFGKHTLKGGFEWKKLGSSIHNGSNLGGTFSFAEDTTGNTATGDTGDDMASFFLGAVSSANTNYYNVLAEYPRQYGYAAHLGDEWRVTPKFIANLSMRWDYITPFAEKFDNLSFFDPNGLNPGAIVNPAAGQECLAAWPTPEQSGERRAMARLILRFLSRVAGLRVSDSLTPSTRKPSSVQATASTTARHSTLAGMEA